MSDESKMIIEFKVGKRVKQVNEPVFKERFDNAEPEYEKAETIYITHYYDRYGEYIGSHTGSMFAFHNENTEYYIPAEST